MYFIILSFVSKITFFFLEAFDVLKVYVGFVRLALL